LSRPSEFLHRLGCTSPISSSVYSSNLLSPTWRQEENATVYDNFNVTASKFQNSFSLAGVLNDINGLGSLGYNNIWMPTCNSSFYYGNWTTSLLQVPGNWWWSTKEWKSYMLPMMNVTFDTQTANFTLDGKWGLGYKGLYDLPSEGLWMLIIQMFST
jgi:hypothetical protein